MKSPVVKLLFFLNLLPIYSCIDRISISIPDSNSSQLVVNGVITDEPGPYTVELSRTAKVEGFFLQHQRKLESQARVTIFDDMGATEVLEEKEPGFYQTRVGGIQGVVGRTYGIKIETTDGKIFESIPEKMKPVGEIDSIYYEFESYLPLNDQTRYGFRFYIDANGLPDIDNLVRWKFTGVFQIEAYPELHTKICGGGPCCPDPRPCSGFVISEIGVFKKVAECTCCTCWVSKYENKPHVSDNQFVSDGIVKRVEVGFVPLEYFSFQAGKYRAEVKQMSLSKESFDYWRLIQAQKEGAASLFQPPIGKIHGNIIEKNGIEQPIGLFYASSVKKKQLYLGFKDIMAKFSVTPLWDCEKGLIAESCILAYPNSSNEPPSDWK